MPFPPIKLAKAILKYKTSTGTPGSKESGTLIILLGVLEPTLWKAILGSRILHSFCPGNSIPGNLS